MYIILPILLILLGIGLSVLVNKDIICNDIATIISMILIVVLSVSGVAFGINTGCMLVVNCNMETYHTEKENLRATYVTLLDKYDTLTKQDITASDSYLIIYDKVIEFNKQVRLAENNKDRAFWTEGLIYDPSYIDIEPIEMKEPYS